MRLSHLSIPALLLALAGCTADVGVGASSASLGDTATCQPGWETTVVSMTTGAEVGYMTGRADSTGVGLAVEAAPGWELGDLYVGIGPSAGSLTWYTVNEQPWVTGWQPRLHIDLSDAALGCDAGFKIIVQVYARPVGTWDRQLASAVGPGSLGEWGYFDERNVCCVTEDPDPGCTFTQGYWKNHEEAWTTGSLVIGNTTYTQAQLLTILRTPVRGDASVALAHQLIAAELNRANGAAGVPAIAEAQDWMRRNGTRLPYRTASGSAAAAQASALTNALASYNEGATGPGHCSD
jgi:hypothetical protein